MMQRFMKTGCKSTLLLLLAFTLSGAALAQYGNGRGRGRFGEGGPRMPQAAQPPENLFKALQAQAVASTITASQLTADWRVISLDLFDRDTYFRTYYTHGDLLSFGGQKYLVAYTLRQSSDPEQRAVQQYYEDQARQPNNPRRTPLLLKDSVLALSLLALNQASSFHQVKQFDPAADIITASSKEELNRISQENLKQIALAVFMYSQDNAEKLPPMIAARSADDITGTPPMPPPPLPPGSAAGTPSGLPPTLPPAPPVTVQQRLLPYVKNSQIFLQPATQRPYLPNYKLSRLPDAKITHPAQTFLFYEDAPNSDGTRNVAFADGHVEGLTEAEFQRQRIVQGISESGYPSAAAPTHKAKAKAKPKAKPKLR